MNEIHDILRSYYDAMEGSPLAEAYHDRHGTESLGILTVYDDERAALIAEHLRPRIENKVVIEVGAGIGLLAFHMAQYAAGVIAIEVDPTWVSSFVVALYAQKPPNVTFIFGRAEEVVGLIRGDVALFCTHSGHEALSRVAGKLAPVVIDVHAELVGVTGVRRG